MGPPGNRVWQSIGPAGTLARNENRFYFAAYGVAVPRVYIHELVDVVGTERSRYQHHMTANWVPEVAGLRRQRCFGVFTVVGSTGRWPQVMNLWELDSWEDLAHDLELELSAPGHRDPVLAAWWERAATFRTGGLDRVLVAHPSSPGVRDWEARGGTGAAVYVQEVLRCPPGAAGDVCDAVVGPGAADHERFGMQLVGAFRTAMAADDEVVALWAVPDWPSWVAYEQASDGGRVEFFHLWERLGGLVTARDRTLVVDAELSPLRIGRQPVAADRRPLDQV